MARHLPRFVPGNPAIVVQNNPGGGGLVTANRLYVTAEKDGTVLAKLERAVPQLAIQGQANAAFDPLKFTWLGSLSSYADDAYLLLLNAAHPARTIVWRAPTVPKASNDTIPLAMMRKMTAAPPVATIVRRASVACRRVLNTLL